MFNRRIRLPSFLRHLPRAPWMVILIGIIATSAVFWQARREELSDFRARFETNSTIRAARVIREMKESLAEMQVLSQLFQKTGSLTRKDFCATVTPFLTARDDIGAIGWIAAAGTLEEEEPSNRTSGPFVMKDFLLSEHPVPTPARRAHYSVLYLDSGSTNDDMAGLDFGSYPQLRASLEQARDTGIPVAIPRRMRNDSDRSELLLFLPVYGGSFAPGRKEERRRALRGFVLGSLRIDRVVKGVFAASQLEGLSLEFLDFSDDGGGRVIYERSVPITERRGSWSSGLLPLHAPFLFREVFAGREWGIRTNTRRGVPSKALQPRLLARFARRSGDHSSRSALPQLDPSALGQNGTGHRGRYGPASRT